MKQKRISVIAGGITLLVGLVVVFGWMLNIPLLKSISPGLSTMKINTALGFFFTGASLIAIRNGNQKSTGKIAAEAFALIVVIIGGLSLLEYIININTGIDQLIVNDVGTAATSDPGRMSVPTAVNFLVLGTAFIFYSRNLFKTVVQILIVITITISLFAMVGYILNLKELFTLGPPTSIALHTSITFLIASLGFLFSRDIISSKFTIRAGLTIALTLSILIVGVSYLNSVKHDEAFQWFEHTLKVQEILQEFNTDITGVQTSERGFALTGDTQYLNDFHNKIELVERDLVGLTQLTSDNPMHQQKLGMLKPLVEENLKQLNYVVNLKQKGMNADVIKELMNYNGEHIMEKIRVITSGMGDEENKLLHIRTEKAMAISSNTKSVMLLGGIFSTVLLVIVFSFLLIENIRRTNAEKEIRESEEKFRNIFENSPTGKLLLMVDGGQKVNRVFCNIVGYSEEELGKLDLNKITYPDDIEESERVMSSLLNNEKVYERYQKRYIHKSGRIVWTDVGIFLQRDENNKPLYFINSISDITEQKAAENALIEKTEELDKYFTYTLDLLCIADTDGNFRRLNNAWESTLGYKLQDLEGKPFLDFVHPDDLDATLAAMADLSKGNEVLSFTNRYLHKDGSYRFIEWRSFPAGDLIYASARDITERRKAEEEIHQINIQLEVTNQELEAFAYSVSHDLRAPLRHIDGFIELLKKKIISTADDSVKRYLNIISDSSKRLGALIDELLSYSRTGRTKVTFKEVDLNEVIKEVLTELKPQTKNRQVKWKIETMPKISADYDLIKLVYQNLVSNSIKFTGHKETAIIELTCRREKGRHIFIVKDNGAGFDMAYSDRLFGVFQRLHGKDEFEGNGIGLANVRKIIHMHNGEIRAEGKVNEGAEFTFWLPVGSG